MTTTTVPSGMKSIDAVVGDGDELDVLSGGTATGTTVNDGGLETIASGGTETGSSIAGGEQDVLGGITTNATVAANGNLFVTSGSSSGAKIGSGGLEAVSGTGKATGSTVMNGGEQDVSDGGKAQTTTIASGGIQYVYANASTSADSVSQGGNDYVYGSTSGAAIHSGGTETVFAGGVATNTVVDGGTLSLASLDRATGTIAFAGTGGRVSVRGASTSVGASLSGFVAGDVVDLLGVTFNAADRITIAGNIAMVLAGSETYAFTLDPSSTRALTLVNHNGSLELAGVSLACFLAGTRIRTAQGLVAVEALVEGDELVTESGQHRPITWIGHRHIDFERHPKPTGVLPYRIAAHAFADGQPATDLFLSPDHAVFVRGALIPISQLALGDVVSQVSMARGTYYHVELDRHDVILAEGLPVETYLETGNRTAFLGQTVTQLFPMLGRTGESCAATWEAHGCAPLAVAGALVDGVRQSLSDRATTRTTPDAGEVYHGELRRARSGVRGQICP